MAFWAADTEGGRGLGGCGLRGLRTALIWLGLGHLGSSVSTLCGSVACMSFVSEAVQLRCSECIPHFSGKVCALVKIASYSSA